MDVETEYKEIPIGFWQSGSAISDDYYYDEKAYGCDMNPPFSLQMGVKYVCKPECNFSLVPRRYNGVR